MMVPGTYLAIESSSLCYKPFWYLVPQPELQVLLGIGKPVIA
jgi:hypothetical protein